MVRVRKFQKLLDFKLTYIRKEGKKKMHKKKRWILPLLLMMIFSTALPVSAAVKFKKVSANIWGASRLSSVSIFEKTSGSSEVLLTLKYGQRVRIQGESANWYKVKKGSIRGYMRKKALVKFNHSKHHIALTFDDGPSAVTTKKALSALKKNNCRATFFLLGQSINDRTAPLLQKAYKMGCEIGNHSYDHPQLTYLGASGAKGQFAATDRKIKQYIGKKSTLCRTPYGDYNQSIVNASGRPHILWSVDTLDWKYRDTDRLISYVSQNARDGAVVLMHDIHPTTVNAVDSICKKLKKKNFEMVTVSELAAIKKRPLKKGRTYSGF